MTAALQDIVVLDLSRILAGPWSTQNLADLGADVIKVERPGTGDDTRRWGPPFATDPDGVAGDAAYFFCCNRGKRSITLDFTVDAGRSVLLELVKKADILVENYKVGGLKKYGLDYDTLSQINPRLIYCSVTGFGQSGPYATRPGYDALIQAMGGLMSITGESDDVPGGGPQKVGVAVVDILTGLYATSAILAALHQRGRTGKGQHIDVSLLDVQVAMLANQASNYLIGNQVPGRLGSAHPSIVPYQPFACADGHVMLAIGNDTQFANLCLAAGCPDLATDPRFATNAQRVLNRDTLIPLLQQRMACKTIDEWCDLGNRHGFPCGPINTVDRVFEDEQVKARQIRVDIDSARYGKVATVASPMRLSDSPVQYKAPPPELGEHTDDVLSELGLDAAKIAELRQMKAI
ncbi:MAG TPA: CaiB/BaiF CoA-transferase family protein [Pusillimonas sp.]|uniref:CaiB/BaiF CoA transferase family protein n=1 Tax=unclassified Pusillimonas TaxID=2640016 RepID=UPI00262B1923|nr:MULTISPECIES: CaiB/BaiF CoA-transferase family protein [unclassified Pusillimonas]HLU19964.1 CaiB/BaiF CoA-transferase family protein [Pusillimonas sp.]